MEQIKAQESVRSELDKLAEEEYRVFSSNLLPGVENVLGVRLPKLRSLAKSLSGKDWKENLNRISDSSFEEIMLQGMVIGYAECTFEERIEAIRSYLPLIDNWSVCDSFCAGLKFVKSEKERFFEFLQEYTGSDKEFDQRFACVMLLDCYLDGKWISKALAALKRMKPQRYYAKVGKSWALAECYLRFPRKSLPVLLKEKDPEVRSKAIQKILESKKITPDEKEEILGLRKKTVS